MTIVLILLAVGLLAWSNGANDNFKGVASLYGSRTCGYRTALAWATATTFAGSVAALFLAQELVARFSGRGLVPDALVTSPAFVLAVATGAGVTVLLATRFGFPISTTHGLTGALVGAGLASGGPVHLGVLGAAFVTLFPYAIDAAIDALPVPERLHTFLFAVKFGAFGLLMALFLTLEPRGLVSIWSRIRTYGELWPFRYQALSE